MARKPTATAAPSQKLDWISRIARSPAVTRLCQCLEEGGVVPCTEVTSGALPLLALILQRQFPARTILLVADGLRMQEFFHQDAQTWAIHFEETKRPQKSASDQNAPQPLFFPAWEVLPHEDKLPHADIISDRLETLAVLARNIDNPSDPAPLIVASASALQQRTLSPSWLINHMRSLQTKDQMDPLDLVEWLEDQGYEPEVQVNHKGEIALRGGILDIFPVNSPWPVRLEFFGDEIESIRYFDPFSQMSREEVTRIHLSPGGELGLLKRMVQKQTPSPPALGSLGDYLPEDTIVLLPEPQTLEQQAGHYAQQCQDHDPFLIEWSELLKDFCANKLAIVTTSETSQPETACLPDSPGQDPIALQLESLEAFRPLMERATDPQVADAQRREFFHQIHRWLRQNFQVHLFCNNAGESQRFEEVWKDYGLDQPSGKSSTKSPKNISPQIHLGSLTRGCRIESAQVVIITDAEIFGRYKVQRPRRLKSPHAQTSRSLLDIDFAEMEEGDYVVHLQHGIGRFLGLGIKPTGQGIKPLEKAGLTTAQAQECLIIEYAPPQPDHPAPRLYVPVTEAHLVSKYVGTGKARPPLHKLGGSRWQKAKDQAAEAVRDLAGEFLSIQAAREALDGYSYQTDTPWQREFESAFLFEETPDQNRAIVQTKTDMERPKPMDRLICGDVGYGKTEVAIRAAFKAVMNGKQVAILVPTTVLAQQHFNTFRERMADYPVRIELLSRFRSVQQQKNVIQQLSQGAVDIVIGTHRLIQNDIRFKDLGLVVIDEEQRFGVLHKEKFKMMRKLVDVLTLSATPIPRTLYLALTGARDMSTIETPPLDRLPVETIVAEYDERVIRSAIQREINRQGQIFYLHNRVHDIEKVGQRLQNLVPEARIVIGHGQMHGDDLENVMTRFVNGDADLLLSTTIIESGLDIPNANTIIIDRADRFGLSDLYQLRGRVGRYKHQAYAYLLIPRHARMLTDARKRISAIKQYSTLGSGFKIAMRDLEIRGAGNLLGAQQSGHITAVGFDLYCQLLKQSINALKGLPVKPRIDVQVTLDFLSHFPGESDGASASPIAGAMIPGSYIQDSQLRLEAYRKMGEIMEPAELQSLRDELRDRFGPIPQPVEFLLQIGGLKLLAAPRQVTSIETREDKVMLQRQKDWILVGGRFPRLTKTTPQARLKEIARLLKAI